MRRLRDLGTSIDYQVEWGLKNQRSFSGFNAGLVRGIEESEAQAAKAHKVVRRVPTPQEEDLFG